MHRLLLASLAIAVFSGCVSMPTEAELAALNYGSAPAIDVVQTIKERMAPRYIYPEATIYNIEPAPKKIWVRTPKYAGNELVYGWAITGRINPKNKYNHYTGAMPWMFVFKNNKITHIFDFRFMDGAYIWPKSKNFYPADY